MWKIRKSIPIKTIILEQIVVSVFKRICRKVLEPKLTAAMKYIRLKLEDEEGVCADLAWAKLTRPNFRKFCEEDNLIIARFTKRLMSSSIS